MCADQTFRNTICHGDAGAYISFSILVFYNKFWLLGRRTDATSLMDAGAGIPARPDRKISRKISSPGWALFAA